MQPDNVARWAELLQCPVSGGGLSVLSDGEVAELNARLQRGALLHRDGSRPSAAVESALGTADRRYVYRVDESIACLLPDLALVATSDARTTATDAEKKGVQSFYDEYGWVKASGGLYRDTLQATDTRSIARNYQVRCNRRVRRHLTGGRFLLDVASGAIPHAEYLEYAAGYEVRICVDFSLRALREARAKIGAAGLFLLGDITRLPLAAGVIDTVISLHTLYHVPSAEQAVAVDELARVTRPGGRVIVVYNWSNSAAMTFLFGLRRECGRIRHAIFGAKHGPAAAGPGDADMPPLYFAPHDYAWFKREIAARHRTRLRVSSAASMQFQAHFFSDRGLGRITQALVVGAEELLPWLAGRYGQYPMFIIDKPRNAATGRRG